MSRDPRGEERSRSRRPGGREKNHNGRKRKSLEAHHADEKEGEESVFFTGAPCGQTMRLNTCMLHEGESGVILSLMAK